MISQLQNLEKHSTENIVNADGLGILCRILLIFILHEKVAKIFILILRTPVHVVHHPYRCLSGTGMGLSTILLASSQSLKCPSESRFVSDSYARIYAEDFTVQVHPTDSRVIL
jgi:hypothetical protein